MTDVPLNAEKTLTVSPDDRLRLLADPIWRAAQRRFKLLLVVCLLLHLGVLLFLFFFDWPDRESAAPVKEIPVQVIVQPPPPPPKPEPKKPEPKKPEPKQKPPQPKYQHIEKPAFDAPRAANQEKIKRESTDDQTHSPVKGNPSQANATKPTQSVHKPAQNVAPEAAKQTTSPEQPKDEKNAEALAKAAPIKDKKSQQRMRQAKHHAPAPDDQRGAVARELASLMPSPNFTFASKTEVSPVSGGTEDMRYLSVLFGLIMRQRHFPPRVLHNDVEVVVAFWINDSGRIIQTELYRTSGYPDYDHAAIAAVRRAAPFPHPPYGEPHGFIAKMDFPAR